MGKKKIITKDGAEETVAKVAPAVSSKTPKKKITAVTLHIEATFNNTKAVVADKDGNTLFWSSAGSLGFKGAKKGTPFAASKVGETLAEKAQVIGIKEFDAIIRGVGSGREPVIRGFMSRGFELTGVKDMTPVPHNGPKAKKPRRV
jgi:small subunit ribosomal protein S11